MEIIGFFKKTKSTNSNDPFLEALVSLSSNDSNFFNGDALTNSDIYSAINIISGDVASNPVLCEVDVLNKMINEKPNDVIDGYHLKFALCANMLLYGNSFAEIQDNHTLQFLPNNEMTVTQDDVTNELTYTYSPDNGRSRNIEPSNILHFKCFTQDGVTGISPLYALKDELKIQKSSNDLMTGFFNSGVHGTTWVQVHKTDLGKDARENIRKSFDEATTGDNALNTVVTDDNTDIKNINLNTDILNLVHSNDWTTRQVAKCFGLPVERLGVENEHSNQVQSNLSYLQGTLQHYFDCFTSELNFKLGHVFEFNTDKLLSVDPATQQQEALNAFAGGILTRNEARQKLGLDPTDNGDIFVNINKNGAENNGNSNGQTANA